MDATKPGMCPTKLGIGPTIDRTFALPALDSVLLVLALACDVNGPRRPGMGSLDLNSMGPQQGWQLPITHYPVFLVGFSTKNPLWVFTKDILLETMIFKPRN